ncbi:hypothetical protein ACFWHR_10785 [Leucobacter sp. NPDC058333]|uniref:hypothetical protein n=1 Tax=Leucobacter sp. NPDC058333 TaxID=3346450 RepID=UPI00364EFE4D
MNEPEAAEPQPTSEPPRGLAPSAGLTPAPGLRPPELRLPEGFTALPGLLDELAPAATPETTTPPPPELTAPPLAATPPPAGDLQPAVTAPPESVEPDFSAPTASMAPPLTPAPLPAPAPRPTVPRPTPKPDVQTGEKSRSGALGWVGFAVVAVIIGIVGFSFLSADDASTAPDPDFTTSDDFSESTSGDLDLSTKETTASEVVESFLYALSEGEGDTARKLGNISDASPLMTDEAVTRAIEAAPITHISTDEGRPSEDFGDVIVTATYDVGDETVTHDYYLWDYSDEWALGNTAVSVYPDGYEGAGLRIAGATVDSSTDAFPIAYPVTVDSKWMLAPGTDGLLNFGDDATITELAGGEPQLSEAGVTEFRRLVSESLDSCLAMTSLSTPCGMDLPAEFSDGSQSIDGTVKRTLRSDSRTDLGSLNPTTTYDPPSRMTAFNFFYADVELDVELNGEKRRSELTSSGPSSLRPEVDFSAEELRVDWK